MGLIRQLEHQTLRIVRQGRGMVQNIGGMTIWTKSCPYLSHGTQMQEELSLSTTGMTCHLVWKMMSMTIVHQNKAIFKLYTLSLNLFSWSRWVQQSYGHFTKQGQVAGTCVWKPTQNCVPYEMIYCVGQRSTNLSNGMDDADIVFKHTEADTMLSSAYAKIRASDS